MAQRRNAAVEWVLTTLCIGFGGLTARLPLSVCRLLGRNLGRLGYWLVPRVRRVALANLDLAYGDALSPAEKRRIARGAAVNVGMVAAEFTHIAAIDEDFVARHVTIKGFEQLEAGRGGLIISGHFGNWEWLAPIVQTFHGKTAEIVRPMNDPRLNGFVDGVRRSNGVTTVPKLGAGREIIRLLRDGYLVGVLVDQSPRDNAVPVTFFGHPCWATIAPIMAAARCRVPVYAVTLTRDDRYHYALELSAPISLVRTGDLRQDLIANTQRCQDAIEAAIRNHPEQWLWLHRRWKPRPRLEAEWLRKSAPKDREDDAVDPPLSDSS